MTPPLWCVARARPGRSLWDSPPLAPRLPRPAALLSPLQPLLLSPSSAFRCPWPAANEGPGPLWPHCSLRAHLSPLVFSVHPELQISVSTQSCPRAPPNQGIQNPSLSSCHHLPLSCLCLFCVPYLSRRHHCLILQPSLFSIPTSGPVYQQEMSAPTSVLTEPTALYLLAQDPHHLSPGI